MKRPRKITLGIMLIVLLSACVNLQRNAVPLSGQDPALFNQLRTGMAKAEVIQALGQPMTTSYSRGAELMHYNCIEKNAYGNDILAAYGVLLRNGSVVAFGRNIGFADDPGQ